MQKYQIFTKFEIDGWMEVEADTLEQAIELAKDGGGLQLRHREEKVSVDLSNSYEWVGDFINDWTELQYPEELQEPEMKYVQIILPDRKERP